MAKTNPIDPNVPAGSEDPKLGDNRIRNLAAGVAELQNVDHYMGTDGGAGTGYEEDAAGEHNKVTLRTGSAPTVEANKGYVYAKDVSGKAELFYKDEDGNEIQITSGGILNSLNLTGEQTADGVKTFSKQAAFTLGLTAAKALVSTLETGTAPLTVASTTKVENLNADKLDGYDVSAYGGGQSHTFPGGLILKHGIAIFSGGVATITFGEEFPNEIVSVNGTPYDTAGTVEADYMACTAKSASGVTFKTRNLAFNSVSWQAWGR